MFVRLIRAVYYCVVLAACKTLAWQVRRGPVRFFAAAIANGASRTTLSSSFLSAHSFRRHNFVVVHGRPSSIACSAAAAQKPCCTKATGAHRRQATIIRVAALIIAIGKNYSEPPGAGDTTETSLPPSEQSISRDDATLARRPLTTRHTGPRPRRN